METRKLENWKAKNMKNKFLFDTSGKVAYVDLLIYFNLVLVRPTR